ncbi:MAG: hypothetical protein JNN17_26510 [Verrucomicrobiaceae bacterium]|nr:hypothetical protein [Verrucomicrobiaceae bacterium]
MIDERHNPDCGSLLPLVKGSPAAGHVSTDCEALTLRITSLSLPASRAGSGERQQAAAVRASLPTF